MNTKLTLAILICFLGHMGLSAIHDLRPRDVECSFYQKVRKALRRQHEIEKKRVLKEKFEQEVLKPTALEVRDLAPRFMDPNNRLLLNNYASEYVLYVMQQPYDFLEAAAQIAEDLVQQHPEFTAYSPEIIRAVAQALSVDDVGDLPVHTARLFYSVYGDKFMNTYKVRNITPYFNAAYNVRIARICKMCLAPIFSTNQK